MYYVLKRKLVSLYLFVVNRLDMFPSSVEHTKFLFSVRSCLCLSYSLHIYFLLTNWVPSSRFLCSIWLKGKGQCLI